MIEMAQRSEPSGGRPGLQRPESPHGAERIKVVPATLDHARAIELRDVSFRYRPEATPALRGVDLAVSAESVALKEGALSEAAAEVAGVLEGALAHVNRPLATPLPDTIARAEAFLRSLGLPLVPGNQENPPLRNCPTPQPIANETGITP